MKILKKKKEKNFFFFLRLGFFFSNWEKSHIIPIGTGAEFLRAPKKILGRAVRFVKGDYSRTSSVTAMLADLEWNTLQQRRMQSKTVMLYRVVHQLVSIPVTPFLIPIRASRGHNMRYAIPRSTVNAHLCSFFPSAIRTWNKLPASTVSAQSLETFRDQLPPGSQHHVHVDRHSNFSLYINCF